MHDFRIASYESHMSSHNRHDIENESRNSYLLKKLIGTRKSTALAVRIAPIVILVSAVLMAVFK